MTPTDAGGVNTGFPGSDPDGRVTVAPGASRVTVHGKGGTEITAAAVKPVSGMTGSDLAGIGVAAGPAEQVLWSARPAMRAGCDGVVAPPREADRCGRRWDRSRSSSRRA
ncbi:hypothetical protein [Streptomyces sp. NPDC090021]|uniref:hypothetical protein n=1 Tax=Streptomyces sp. NPDC090021 TaxID=3365919 RepID=UPI003810606F